MRVLCCSGDAALGELGREGGIGMYGYGGGLGLSGGPPGLGVGLGPFVAGGDGDGPECGGEGAGVARALVRLLGQALHEQRGELWREEVRDAVLELGRLISDVRHHHRQRATALEE